MFKRDIIPELQALVDTYSVVTITGPRQSGKTTLVRGVYPNREYVNLEAPDTLEKVVADPRGFLAEHPNGVILDEIQRFPELLSYIQTIVDEQPERKGLFILTGSYQVKLHEAITQPLAGRTALLKLLPLSITELQKASLDFSLNEYLYQGLFPRIYNDKLNPTKAYRNYYQTYIERDVRKIINIKDISLFQKFVKLCVGRIGQLLNMDSLANEVGVSSHTIKEWLSVLQVTYIVFLLQPYFENFGKRIIKSPKLYFCDVGLATYLLDIENIEQVKRDPLRGNLVENLVILELIKQRTNQGLDPQLYYFRDSRKNEVDVIFKTGYNLIPIEIKAAQTFNRSFLKGLNYFQNLVADRCSHGFLIYSGEQEQQLGMFKLLNFKNSAAALS
jgi:hypothetical protein